MVRSSRGVCGPGLLEEQRLGDCGSDQGGVAVVGSCGVVQDDLVLEQAGGPDVLDRDGDGPGCAVDLPALDGLEEAFGGCADAPHDGRGWVHTALA